MTFGEGTDKASRVGLVLVVAAVAGVLLAGLALPVVGALGLATKAGADSFDSLPSELSEPPLPQVSRILAADGSVLASFYYENRIAVPLKQVAPIMQKAQVAIEDSRFYSHHGVDFKGVLRAALHDQGSGSGRQGGSTLTQQYVKNVLIESATTSAGKAAAHAPTLGRKIREARYALALEQRLTKDQILERYLNIAFYGDGAYGVATASLHYFSIPPKKLTLPQAALLAGLVQNPVAYNPHLHPQAAKTRRDQVLERMTQLGVITPQDEQTALATPLKLKLRVTDNGCAGTAAPFFCDYVLADLRDNPALGSTRADRIKVLLRGGLIIRTTLDSRMQKAAQAAVDAQVPRTSQFAASVAMVQPGTGQIKALAINKVYGSSKKRGQTQVDYAADADHGGSGGFQSGSTAKVFVLAAAMKKGIPLATTINSPPKLTNLTGFANCLGQDTGPYPSVSNAEDSEGGRFNLLNGTWDSVNTFYVQLEQQTGVCQPAKLAQAMGVTQANGRPLNQYPSLVLGTNEVSPLDMAGAYATFAAHGKYCPRTAITAVTSRGGRAFKLAPTVCSQALDPGLADTMNYILQGVIDGHDPRRTGINASIGRPVAGKTGTVESFSDAWFIGYTPDLATAVALGDPRGGQSHPLVNVVINGRFWPHVFGGDIPAAIFRQAMTEALVGVPPTSFSPPDPQFVNGISNTVPTVQGLSVAEAFSQLQAAGFVPQLAPGAVASEVPAGSVATTSPPGGSSSPPGSTVLVYLSNGHPPPAPTTTPPVPPAGGTESPVPAPQRTCKGKKCH